jgi:hypothetical protein
MPHRKKKKPAG